MRTILLRLANTEFGSLRSIPRFDGAPGPEMPASKRGELEGFQHQLVRRPAFKRRRIAASLATNFDCHVLKRRRRGTLSGFVRSLSAVVDHTTE